MIYQMTSNLHFHDLEGNTIKLKAEHYLKTDTEYRTGLYFQKVCDNFE